MKQSVQLWTNLQQESFLCMPYLTEYFLILYCTILSDCLSEGIYTRMWPAWTISLVTVMNSFANLEENFLKYECSSSWNRVFYVNQSKKIVFVILHTERLCSLNLHKLAMHHYQYEYNFRIPTRKDFPSLVFLVLHRIRTNSNFLKFINNFNFLNCFTQTLEHL